MTNKVMNKATNRRMLLTLWMIMSSLSIVDSYVPTSSSSLHIRPSIIIHTPKTTTTSLRRKEEESRIMYPFVSTHVHSSILPSLHLSASSSSSSETEEITTTSSTNKEEEEEQQQQQRPIVIPEINTKTQSKLEIEFYTMMTEFTQYTKRDINSIPNHRYRALYEGVASGATEAEVLQAFAVVFQDLLPVRVAGRMIYRHLKSVMERNIEKRVLQEERVMDETGLSLDEIDEGRRAFMAILDEMKDQTNGSGSSGSSSSSSSGKKSELDDGELTIDLLINSGIVQTIVEVLEYESFEEFVTKLEQDENGKLNFERFMISMQKCAPDSNDSFCSLNFVLSEVIKRMDKIRKEEEDENEQIISTDEQKNKFSERFDGMVTAFEEWEDLKPTGDGRMAEVLSGCFAGAKNEKIVAALKIVYMDYSALRIGGDLVFKLMKKLVLRNKKR